MGDRPSNPTPSTGLQAAAACGGSSGVPASRLGRQPSLSDLVASGRAGLFSRSVSLKARPRMLRAPSLSDLMDFEIHEEDLHNGGEDDGGDNGHGGGSGSIRANKAGTGRAAEAAVASRRRRRTRSARRRRERPPRKGVAGLVTPNSSSSNHFYHVPAVATGTTTAATEPLPPSPDQRSQCSGHRASGTSPASALHGRASTSLSMSSSCSNLSTYALSRWVDSRASDGEAQRVASSDRCVSLCVWLRLAGWLLV